MRGPRSLPPLDAPAGPDAVTDVADQLRLSVTRLARRLRQETQGELTPSLLSALHTVAGLGEATLGDLAEAERLQPSTVTVLAGRLEERGLITRQPDPSDRRVVRVRLSAEGRRLVERSRHRKTAYLARRLRSLPPDDLATLGRASALLDRLMEGL